MEAAHAARLAEAVAAAEQTATESCGKAEQAAREELVAQHGAVVAELELSLVRAQAESEATAGSPPVSGSIRRDPPRASLQEWTLRRWCLPQKVVSCSL